MVFRFVKSVWLSIRQAMIANEEVQQLVKNYPLLFTFLRNRFEKYEFSGPPLTFLSLALIFTFSLFLGITEDVVTSDPIVIADAWLANLFYSLRSGWLVGPLRYVSFLGNWQTVVAAAVLFSFAIWVRKNRSYILPLWSTIIGSEAFTFLGKLTFRRQRPETVNALVESSFSFPSGHATISVAFYGFIIYFLWRNVERQETRAKSSVVGLAIIIAVGFSRLYLGVHYLSDVIGGYLAGLLWLIIGIALSEWLHSKKG